MNEPHSADAAGTSIEAEPPHDHVEPSKTGDSPQPAVDATDQAANAAASSGASAAPPADAPSTTLVSVPGHPGASNTTQRQAGSATEGSTSARVRNHLESLTSVVLDAADVASKSSEAAVQLGTNLKVNTDRLDVLTSSMKKGAIVALCAFAGLVIVMLTFVISTSMKLSGRIAELDAAILAVGKRVVELNSTAQTLEAGTAKFEAISRSIETLGESHDTIKKIGADFDSKFELASKQTEAISTQIKERLSKPAPNVNDQATRQLQDLSARVQGHTSTISSLGKDVKDLNAAVAGLSGLRRDVQALVTLQRERYIEAIQRPAAAPPKEPTIQYPRQQRD